MAEIVRHKTPISIYLLIYFFNIKSCSVVVVLVRQSVDTLHCRYAPGISPVHQISALLFVGFSFPYAGYLCVFGTHKLSSSVSVGIFTVRI